VPREPWNHNLHFYRLILDAIPPGCRRALDVGCGEGTLTRQLHHRVPAVVGIDRDPASIEAARAHPQADDIEYVQGDFLAAPFSPRSFDLIAAVASLHHMDAPAALARMSGLLAPGGVLVVVGLARSRYPADLPRDVLAAMANTCYRLTRSAWQPPVSIRAPFALYPEMEEMAERVVPGARFRRHLLWRYSLIWQR
jgi:2-polyprenyl-3-methyl-5-hydroxy-6-metoxy-1,4-benzoquinol methylase